MKRFVFFVAAAAGALCFLGSSVAADDEKTIADAFSRELGPVAKQSKQAGIPVAVMVAPRKGENVELLADPRIHARLKWFLPATVQSTTKLGQALNAEAPTAVAYFDAEGKILGRTGAKDAAKDALKLANELAKKSREGFLATLGQDGVKAVDAKNAATGLIRMGGNAAELVPLLRHKSTDVRGLAAKALLLLPREEVVLAALDGLASDDTEMRAACYPWAAARQIAEDVAAQVLERIPGGQAFGGVGDLARGSPLEHGPAERGHPRFLRSQPRQASRRRRVRHLGRNGVQGPCACEDVEAGRQDLRLGPRGDGRAGGSAGRHRADGGLQVPERRLRAASHEGRPAHAGTGSIPGA